MVSPVENGTDGAPFMKIHWQVSAVDLARVRELIAGQRGMKDSAEAESIIWRSAEAGRIGSVGSRDHEFP